MKLFFYILVLIISILTIVYSDTFSSYIKIFIDKSLLNLSNINFALIYLFFAIVIGLFGVSVSILSFGYFLFLDLHIAFLFSLINIILTGITAFLVISNWNHDKSLLGKYKSKIKKFNLLSPYFPIVLRLIPGVPFMAQNIILLELKHGFRMYFVSLVIVALISSSIFTFLVYVYEL